MVVWGRQGETCRPYLTKGSPVMTKTRCPQTEGVKDFPDAFDQLPPCRGSHLKNAGGVLKR